MSLGQRVIVFIGTLLAVAALAISLVTLLHEQWISYTVNESAGFTKIFANRHYEYYSRHRGLIWTCVPIGTRVLADHEYDVRHGRCFEESLAWVNGTADMYVVNLRRAQIGLKSASVLLNLTGLFLGFIVMMMWCLRPQTSAKLYRSVRAHVVACWCFGAMIAIAAMAVYHYTLDLEKYMALPRLTHYYVNWETLLKQNTTWKWDIMYYLEWGEIGILVIAALFMRLSLCLFEDKERKDKPLMADDHNLYHSNPMMQLSTDSLPPYDAYKSNAGANSTRLNQSHTEDAHSARSGHTYDNQAKNVYRIY